MTTGSFELCPGDGLFARPLSGSGKAKDDISVAWLMGRSVKIHPIAIIEILNIYWISEILSYTLQKKLKTLVRKLIGPAAMVEKTGKTAFQRSPRAEPLRNASGAINMAISYEQPRGTHGPAENMKIHSEDEFETDHWLLFRKDFLSVSVWIINDYAYLYFSTGLCRGANNWFEARPRGNYQANQRTHRGL
jgi:hypothetical protein